MDERLVEYRSWLVAADQKAQEDYDKTVLSLSGGALGISFAFIKDIVGAEALVSVPLLLGSWLAWGLSVACVLGSFFFSQQALRTAIRQVDAGEIHKRAPGGWLSTVTAGLNAFGGIPFLLGVILIAMFVSRNLR